MASGIFCSLVLYISVLAILNNFLQRKEKLSSPTENRIQAMIAFVPHRSNVSGRERERDRERRGVGVRRERRGRRRERERVGVGVRRERDGGGGEREREWGVGVRRERVGCGGEE